MGVFNLISLYLYVMRIIISEQQFIKLNKGSAALQFNMKYIITESQYNKVIDKFITYQLEPHKEITAVDNSYWVKEDGEVVANLYPHTVYISTMVWNTLSNIADLDDNGVVEVIREWLKIHYNLSNVDIVNMGTSPYISPQYLKNSN